MQLQYHPVKLYMIRSLASPKRCPLCEDSMFAPIASEFVQGREIRHRWVCDACGESTLACIELLDL